MNDGQKKKPELPLIKESPVTYDIYANLPDDGNRYEVADGVLELMSPGPYPVHQIVSYELQRKLDDDCRQDYIVLSAPLDVILSDIEVRQPDMILIHRSRLSIIKRHAVVGAPDLVVEISSEHSLRRDKVQKTKAYAKYGVPEYWIIDLTNYHLEQYILREHGYELADMYSGDDRIRSDKLACVSFTMNELVENMPELSE
ncbi:Uma2 family endonuclease [Paenibacillaceae bacterium WGS1546]|uniref:Uma2 family endonuclease n=1 Tax=Cohnella sp. WGS1546 TaxID=3366810 RepID=UPI00372CFFD2